MSDPSRSVAIYCGALPGNNPVLINTAKELGRAIASEGFCVVYGGSRLGLMGSVAESALAAGGEVVGVFPNDLVPHESPHPNLTALHLVESFHMRKVKMTALSDSVVVFPGGFGTLDEAFETLTFCKLGVHRKRVFFLNVDGIFDGLFEYLDRVAMLGLVADEHARMAHKIDSVDELVVALRSQRDVNDQDSGLVVTSASSLGIKGRSPDAALPLDPHLTPP